VLRAKIEEVVLPLADGERVDVIISEPMGFMLVHERMLESFMIARQVRLRCARLVTRRAALAPYSRRRVPDHRRRRRRRRRRSAS
jgi:hypothetical protein